MNTVSVNARPTPAPARLSVGIADEADLPADPERVLG